MIYSHILYIHINDKKYFNIKKCFKHIIYAISLPLLLRVLLILMSGVYYMYQNIHGKRNS